jgi:hypothetical protein
MLRSRASNARADLQRAPARRLEACGHAVLTLRDARTYVRCRAIAAARALLRVRTDEPMPRSRLVAEPLPCSPISRCQTAHVFSFPHAFARGLALLSPTGSRGGRSADRRILLSLSRLSARVSRAGEARRVRSLARTHARLSALHHDVCRPGPCLRWSFDGRARFSPAAARRTFPSPALPPDLDEVPTSRGERFEPPPQDATPRSAFRIVSGDAPH